MEYVVDAALADVVLDKIIERISSGGYPYSNFQARLPQMFVPPKLALGGTAEIWYWIVVCLWMRGGTNSTDSAKALMQMHQYLDSKPSPNPFDPAQAAKMTELDMVTLMKAVGLGMHKVAPFWIENATRICSRWHGDCQLLFAGVNDYATACDRLLQRDGLGLQGFQYKMVSMILYFLTERGLIEPFPFPPPVDFHLQRIALATGLVTVPGVEFGVMARTPKHYAALEALLRQLYFNYCQDHEVGGNLFTNGLWVLSRQLCRLNPGNKTLQLSAYRARRTMLQAYQPDWSKASDVRAFENSCASCPVQAHCRKNVPSGPRYRLGQQVTSRRLEPPQSQLFSPNLQIISGPNAN